VLILCLLENSHRDRLTSAVILNSAHSRIAMKAKFYHWRDRFAEGVGGLWLFQTIELLSGGSGKLLVFEVESRLVLLNFGF
jgi:hypothetical protein